MSSGKAELSPRLRDIQFKQELIGDLLDEHGYEGVLLSRADNFTWFTSGGNDVVHLAGERGTSTLFVTHTDRFVIANNIESGRLFQEELDDFGFELKEYPWYESPDRARDELVRSQKVASDDGLGGTPSVLEDIRSLRLSLTELERERYAQLGHDTSHAMEATCRSIQPGQTEREIAAMLSHRLIRHGMVPVVLLVAADQRIGQFRHPVPTDRKVEKTCMVAVVARQYGLHASTTRVVSLGPPDADLARRHQACCMVDATFIFFSRPGQPAAEVLRRAKRIYEKTGFPDEWTLHHQGGITGYAPREDRITPDSTRQLREHMAIAWNPSITGTKSEDTILIDDAGFQVLTNTLRWPSVVVSVKGYDIPRPDILAL